jgi:GNAT superfamily N-acetyltransferase
MPPRYFLADRTLAQRLERAEGSSNAAFVDARVRLDPGLGAEWCDVAGTYAMFDGADSPLTQTFGLGLFAPVTAAELAELEAFFADRRAPVHHEVSPVGDRAHLSLLPERGYQPVEYTSVLHQPLPRADAAVMPWSASVQARHIEADEVTRWAKTTAQGWSETPEITAFMRDFGQLTAESRGTHCFLAERDGTAIAAGALTMHGGVALLAGASTVPEWRGQGAQAALLAARLRFAAEQGCDLAMMGAEPGSASQRNAERQGFRIAYTRIKWRLRPPA